MNSKKYIPILIPERVRFKKKIESKKCAFDELTALLVQNQREVTRNQIFDALIAREKLGNTYIGRGLAIPRADLHITHPRAALLALKQGIKLSSADKLPIHIFLGIILPSGHQEKYSLVLSEFNKKILLEDDLRAVIKSENTDKVAKHFDELLTDTI